MSQTLTLYHKTGFTSLDIPASVSVLQAAAAAVTEADALQIVQPYPLTSIDIRATWDDVKDVDYAKIDDMIYAADPAPMQAPDVCRLSLTLSAVTTAAGSFSIVGGYTTRTTEHSDEWGEWGEEDPLCAPTQPLLLDVSDPILQDGAGRTVTEATIDLVSLATQMTSNALKAVTFTDTSGDESAEKTITVPYTEAVTTATEYTLDGTKLPGPGGVRLYTGVGGGVLGLIRSLGLEGAIVGQISIPENDIALQTDLGSVEVKNCAAVTQREDSGLSPLYAEVKNKKLLYSSYMRWGLITCAGNKAEFKVEDISADGSSPQVTRKSDPRPDGAPYFRFTYYMGTSEVSNPASFWSSCIRGMQWRNVPLVWSGASGSYLAKENFTYQEESTAAAQRYSQETSDIQWKRTGQEAVLSTISSAARALPQMLSPDPGASVSAITGFISDAVMTTYNTQNKQQDITRAAEQTRQNYERDRQNARYNFAFQQSVTVPSVNFPLNSSVLQDLYGNGVFVYRYRYRDEDVKRIDRLLTMYGYKITRPAAITDLYPEGKTTGFTYLEAAALSVAGSGARWLDDLISAQIGAGVRVWWQKPDPAAFE